MGILSAQRRPRSTTKLITTVCLFGVAILFARQLYQHMLNLEFASSYLPHCRHTSTIHNLTIHFDTSSYSIHHYPEFVCPQNFRNLADWIYGWPDREFEEALEHPMNEERLIVPNLPHGSIIFVKTDRCERFFSKIYPYIQHPFVLITGQGDASAPGDYLHHLHASDSKIIHWFGQNADIDSTTSAKFTPIPIGTSLRLT